MDPNNPFGLSFSADEFTTTNNSIESNDSEQQDTIMSSHTDPNPADVADDDPDEMARISCRFNACTSRLQTIETLLANRGIPGGRAGRPLAAYDLSTDSDEEVVVPQRGIGRPRFSTNTFERIHERDEDLARRIVMNPQNEPSQDTRGLYPPAPSIDTASPNKRKRVTSGESLDYRGDSKHHSLSQPFLASLRGLRFGDSTTDPPSRLRLSSFNASFSSLERTDELFDMVADTMPGGDGVRRRKRADFNRSKNLPMGGYEEHRRRIQPMRSRPEDDDDDTYEDHFRPGIVDRPTRPKPTSTSRAPTAAGTASPLDRASTTLGLQTTHLGSEAFITAPRRPGGASNPPPAFRNPAP